MYQSLLQRFSHELLYDIYCLSCPISVLIPQLPQFLERVPRQLNAKIHLVRSMSAQCHCVARKAVLPTTESPFARSA
jgi:hypothetical protein